MPELQTYNKKRNFRRTSEPKGELSKSHSRDFMVHMHDATRLHYDLRLQWEGVLLSWAVPKGPSFNPEDKRLALQTEDHPVDYKSFEGVIPKDSYGAGPSLIWDAGTWRPLVADVRKALKKGHLRFFLKGVRLRGIWNLVKMHRGDKPNQWLLIKEEDKYASPNTTITGIDTSVATGLAITELAEQPDEEVELTENSGEAERPLPDDLRPQLATLTEAAPSYVKNWIVEDKYDGYRLIVVKDGGSIRLLTRNQHDWSEKLPKLCKAFKDLPLKTAVLDGELVAFSKQTDKNESFQTLQNFLQDDNEPKILRYFAFDILQFEDVNLEKETQTTRREILEKLFSNFESETIRISRTQTWSKDLQAKTCERGREGLILKNPTATYQHRRTKNWLKLKCDTRDEYVIIGWTNPRGSRKYFGSLLLAEEINGRLEYRGKVGAGFDEKKLKTVFQKIKKLSTEECPVEECEDGKNAHWVKPHVLAEVRYAEKSRDNRLRHPTFLGLREDKFYQSRAKVEAVESFGLTHPKKILYPKQGLTKEDLLLYYQDAFPWFKKQGCNRPLSLVRCPDGYEKCFFQKHLDTSKDQHPPQIKIKTKSKSAEYSYLKEFKDLAALIQLGVLEYHAWNCSIADTERPQYVVWDLDPGPGVKFEQVTQSALLIKLILEAQDRVAYVRTTGGKGLHVLTEVRGLDWNEAKTFSKSIGQMLVDADPDLYLLTATKSKRKGKIFIDYLRNSKSATSILNYSTRAREGAPVATPLFWDEVHENLNPSLFNVKTIPQRLRTLKADPWENFSAPET